MISPQIVINVLGFLRGRGKSRAETEVTTIVTVCLMKRRGNNTYFRTKGARAHLPSLFTVSQSDSNLSKGREEVEKQGQKARECSRRLTAPTEI